MKDGISVKARTTHANAESLCVLQRLILSDKKIEVWRTISRPVRVQVGLHRLRRRSAGDCATLRLLIDVPEAFGFNTTLTDAVG